MKRNIAIALMSVAIFIAFLIPLDAARRPSDIHTPIVSPVTLVEPVEALQAEDVPYIEKAPEPQPEAPKTAQVANVSGSRQEWLTAAGIAESDWGYVDYIVSKESSWNPLAVNRSSGATGLCQSLPASKMASSGSDYMTNPVTQLRWCNGYAVSRYGSWAQAHQFWVLHHWW